MIPGCWETSVEGSTWVPMTCGSTRYTRKLFHGSGVTDITEDIYDVVCLGGVSEVRCEVILDEG